ncbi:MAG TPA: CocE/NonD family hydrolase [Mycobacteriales bacterium]|nr:CocE/NonD family hydrolase [Mycobacteriales bacterium]
MPGSRRPALLLALTAVVLGTATAGAAAPERPAEAPGVRSEPTATALPSRPLEVETPFGTIRGDVILPDTAQDEPVPVILTYTPYSVLYQSLDPLRESRADDAVAAYFVPRGYARAVFDVVGTYGSTGCTDFGGLGERKTAAAVVDFLAAQPWSNGSVGMIGASYDGTTAIAAAVEAPPALKAVVPQVAIDRWYDYMYNDGVRMTLEDNPTGLADPPVDSPLDYDVLYGVVPPYPSLTSDPAGTAAVLADHLNPCNRVENQRRGYETDPLYDDFWVERDYRALASGVTAAVLLEGAWLDDNVKHWGTTRFFSALPEGEGAPDKRMVIGQWSHSTSRFPDAQDLRLAWFDHHLKGLPNDVLDRPLVESQGSDGVRRQEDAWPPAATREASFRLVPGSAGEGEMGAGGAATAWTDLDPALTEDVVLRRLCAVTCARFSAPPVTEAVRVVGSPRLDLTAVTDATSTHVVPLLLDVAPDGTARTITRGVFNSNQRHGLATSSPLVPGAAWSASVELWDTDWTLRAGHRLELVLVSSEARWALSDTTRATTRVDVGATSLTVPLAPL